MLTNDDLRKIQGLIQEELDPVKNDMSGLKLSVGEIQLNVTGLKKDMKIIKQRLGKIEKTASVMLKTLNEDDVELEIRVTKIEKHLGISN